MKDSESTSIMKLDNEVEQLGKINGKEKKPLIDNLQVYEQ